MRELISFACAVVAGRLFAAGESSRARPRCGRFGKCQRNGDRSHRRGRPQRHRHCRGRVQRHSPHGRRGQQRPVSLLQSASGHLRPHRADPRIPIANPEGRHDHRRTGRHPGLPSAGRDHLFGGGSLRRPARRRNRTRQPSPTPSRNNILRIFRLTAATTSTLPCCCPASPIPPASRTTRIFASSKLRKAAFPSTAATAAAIASPLTAAKRATMPAACASP